MMDKPAGRFRLGQAIEYAEQCRADLGTDSARKVNEAIDLMRAAARIERQHMDGKNHEDDDPN